MSYSNFEILHGDQLGNMTISSIISTTSDIQEHSDQTARNIHRSIHKFLQTGNDFPGTTDALTKAPYGGILADTRLIVGLDDAGIGCIDKSTHEYSDSQLTAVSSPFDLETEKAYFKTCQVKQLTKGKLEDGIQEYIAVDCSRSKAVWDGEPTVSYMKIYSSTDDGKTWTLKAELNDYATAMTNVEYANGKYYIPLGGTPGITTSAVWYSGMYVSDDLVNWTKVNANFSSFSPMQLGHIEKISNGNLLCFQHNTGKLGHSIFQVFEFDTAADKFIETPRFTIDVPSQAKFFTAWAYVQDGDNIRMVCHSDKDKSGATAARSFVVNLDTKDYTWKASELFDGIFRSAAYANGLTFIGTYDGKAYVTADGMTIAKLNDIGGKVECCTYDGDSILFLSRGTNSKLVAIECMLDTVLVSLLKANAAPTKEIQVSNTDYGKNELLIRITDDDLTFKFFKVKKHAQSASFTVDWGDGTVSTFDNDTYTFNADSTKSNAVSHQYAKAGYYTIRISNDISMLALSDQVSGVATAYSAAYSKKVLKVCLTSSKISDYDSTCGFCGCDNMVSFQIGDNIKEFPQWFLNGCKKLKELEIPVGCEKLGTNATMDLLSLSSINIPPTVKHIDGYNFGIGGTANYNISQLSLAETDIGELEISSIGTYFLGKHGALTSLTMPESLKTIGNRFCENASWLEEVHFGSNVEFIETDFLKNAGTQYEAAKPIHTLNIVDFSKAKQVPILGNNPFYPAWRWGFIKILVPSALYDEWKVAENWNILSNQLSAV